LSQDRVEPSEGFGRHSHREFEIFSYIVSGELEHRDSMGNLEIMKEGDVQSEYHIFLFSLFFETLLCFLNKKLR